MSIGIGRIFRRRWRRADGTWAESRYWSVGFPYKGRERVEAAKDSRGQKAQTEAQARQYLRARLEEIGRGEYVPRQDRLSYDEMVELLRADYERKNNRSWPNVGHKLKPLTAHFGGWRAQRIDHPAVLAYTDRRLKAGAARATINGEIRLLRRMLRLAVRSKALSKAPMLELLAEENRRHNAIGPGDFQRLLGNFQDRDVADLVEFLYHTGWRVKSVESLEKSDVDWAHQTVKLRAATSKNKEPMLLCFAEFPTMREILLRRRPKLRPDCPFIFHREGQPIQSFRGEWENVTKEAGLTGLLVHDLCRSAAVNLARAGVDETTAAKFMNRKSREIYKLYREAGLHIDSRDTMLAGAALERYFQAEKERAKVTPIESRKQNTDRAAKT